MKTPSSRRQNFYMSSSMNTSRSGLPLALLLLCGYLGQSSAHQGQAQTTDNEAARTTGNVDVRIVSYQSWKLVEDGSSRTLICEMSGDGDPTTLKWFKDGVEVSSDSNSDQSVELHGNELFLSINIFNEDYEGNYHCEGEGRRSRVTELEMYQSIEFHSSETQSGILGTNSLIECVVTGDPVPDVTWRKNRRRLQNDGKYQITMQGLMVNNVTRDDAGMYRCRAMMRVPAEAKSLYINFAVISQTADNESPQTTGNVDVRIISYQSWILLEDGSSHTIICEMSGDGDPTTLKWFKDGVEVEVSSDSNSDPSVELHGNELFLLINIFKEDYEGNYHCEGDGKRSRVTELEMYQDIEFHSSDTQSGILGTNSLIECVVTGDPAPEVRWYKGYTRLQNDGKYQITAQGLMVNNVTRDDEGVYKCRALMRVPSITKQLNINFAVICP